MSAREDAIWELVRIVPVCVALVAGGVSYGALSSRVDALEYRADLAREALFGIREDIQDVREDVAEVRVQIAEIHAVTVQP